MNLLYMYIQRFLCVYIDLYTYIPTYIGQYKYNMITWIANVALLLLSHTCCERKRTGTLQNFPYLSFFRKAFAVQKGHGRGKGSIISPSQLLGLGGLPSDHLRGTMQSLDQGPRLWGKARQTRETQWINLWAERLGSTHSKDVSRLNLAGPRSSNLGCFQAWPKA